MLDCSVLSRCGDPVKKKKKRGRVGGSVYEISFWCRASMGCGEVEIRIVASVLENY